ncbi:hypothetical protein VHP8226_01324 [Vibrio hippocampi]|uniref:Uncharacterized protein n=1 Tax=Vibrio hippocampi TaxID=654686 RepID=A0ABN8DIU0_9VIBR|nr:hypothetical protein VHP8226_01324 [Vibrio hippocampi]
MYGTEQTKAFCCNCNKLTLHKYTMFGTQTEQSPWIKGFLLRTLAEFISKAPTGDYKCTLCGTYLNTPDHLD